MTTSDPTEGRIEAPFTAQHTLRLRFTRDVLGADRSILADLLEPTADRPARVQFWVDAHVAEACPDLPRSLLSVADDSSGRIEPAGEVQIVPGGEVVKNDPAQLERILGGFHEAGLDRRSYVVVVGGGAVLDAVGFGAAVAHRGIRLVRLPTTTLAQADSGVGVKNAVNYFGKKNWMGTFAVPWAVINDITLLSTLSDRDFRAGFSEAVKVSLLKDASVFGELCRVAPRIRGREPEASQAMIRASVRMHLDHITKGGDPFETREARPLDFGHWSAHRLEALTQFRVRHGEAVAIGVAIDSVYSSMAIGLPGPDAAKILECLRDLGFQLDHPVLRDPTPLLEGLEEFRQHLGGRLTVTMLQGIGRPVDVHEVDAEAMHRAIAFVAGSAISGVDPGPGRII